MIKKILKWTGIILLLLILAVTVVTASRQNLKYDAPYPDIKASTHSNLIARGKELIYGPAHCTDCHSTANNPVVYCLIYRLAKFIQRILHLIGKPGLVTILMRKLQEYCVMGCIRMATRFMIFAFSQYE
jgi:hypothetical protein